MRRFVEMAEEQSQRVLIDLQGELEGAGARLEWDRTPRAERGNEVRTFA